MAGDMISDPRSLFDIPSGVTYLNCAYMSPILRVASEVGKRGVERKLHPWNIVRRDFFSEVEEARELFARLIGAEPEDIALAASTSYGASLASINIPVGRGQTIVVPAREHFSNVYRWMLQCRESGAELVTVPHAGAGDWTSAILDRIDRRTAIIAVPNCHWHDGSLIDLDVVGRAARDVGAALVVDGAQSIGARPFDVRHIKPAFLLAAAYKWLLGPYGMAFVYVSPEYQKGRPLEHHSFNRIGAPDIPSSIDYTEDFLEGARRYDVGHRSNFIQLPMIKVALEQIIRWGVSNIAAWIKPIIRRIEMEARTLGLSVPAIGAGHMIGLRFPGGIPAGLEESLLRRRIYVSVRADCLRVSPHVYNTGNDVSLLFDVISDFVPRGARRRFDGQ